MNRRDAAQSLPQDMEAHWAGVRESALADFHELRQDFSQPSLVVKMTVTWVA